MSRNYEYIIRVDGKEVWRGKNPKGRLFDLKKKSPNKRVSIEQNLYCDIATPFF